MERRISLAISSIFVACVLTGCGSTPNASQSPRNQTIANGSANSSNSPSTPLATPGQTPIPGITGPLASSNVDVNAPSAGDIMKGRRRIVDVPANGKAPAQMSVPAPENSSMVSTMDGSGVARQTRTFTGDPNIAKLERLTSAAGQTSTIYLKNGRAVRVPQGKITSVVTVTLAELRQLAGIKPPQPPRAVTDTKKSDSDAKKP